MVELNDVLRKLDAMDTCLSFSPKTDYFDEDHEKLHRFIARYEALKASTMPSGVETTALYRDIMQAIANMGVSGTSLNDYSNTRLKLRG